MCGYGEDPEFCHSAMRRARQEHRCTECHLPIPVGAVHWHTFGKWDGEVGTHRQHRECRRLLELIADEYCGGEQWAFGTLLEEIDEYEFVDDDFDDGDVLDRHRFDYDGTRDVHPVLYGPGHLHGALEAIRARYAPASPSPAL